METRRGCSTFRVCSGTLITFLIVSKNLDLDSENRRLVKHERMRMQTEPGPVDLSSQTTEIYLILLDHYCKAFICLKSVIHKHQKA